MEYIKSIIVLYTTIDLKRVEYLHVERYYFLHYLQMIIILRRLFL